MTSAPETTPVFPTFEILARLLEYPTNQDYAAVPALAALSQDEREELFTATFDVTPACVPYVSIHLFGEENFKRGEFMAALQARYAEASYDPGLELPDHLCNLLRFLTHCDEAERRELIQFCLLGPLSKMIGALRVENAYRALLEIIRVELRAAYPELEAAPSPLEQMQNHGTCNTALAGCGGCGSFSDNSSDHD